MKLVQLDLEEREKGRGFMQRVKQRWDTQYPGRGATSKQNLRDNAVRFRKEPEVIRSIITARQEGAVEYVGRSVETLERQQGGSINWTAPVKARLVEIDKEERQGGRGFMKRVKERWDAEFPEYNRINDQTLRDNAARFRKEPEIEGLIMVRERTAREQVAEDIVYDEVNNDDEQSWSIDDLKANETEGEVLREEDYMFDNSETELQEGDADLEREFHKQLNVMEKTTITEIKPRDKLLKVRMTPKVEGSANRILEKHMKKVEDRAVITDAVYAMGKAVAEISNVTNRMPKGNAKGGNRRERKLRKKIKELRQLIAMAGNELYRRKKRRKATELEVNTYKGTTRHRWCLQ